MTEEKGSQLPRLVVGAAVKDSIELRASGDLVEALNTHVFDLLQLAQKRAKANGRQTIRPEDL